MTSSAYYVYGLCRMGDGFQPDGQGVLRSEVTGIAIGDLMVIVSEAPETEIMATRRNMLAHTKVLEGAMEHGPVLPFRFGMIVPAAALDNQLVQGRERELHQILSDLSGRTEVGIRITLDETSVMQLIVDSRQDLKAAYEAVAGQDEKRTHYQRLELGREVAQNLEATRDEIGRRALERLAAVGIDLKELDRTGDREALHLACLATAEQENALLTTLEEIDAEHPGLYEIKYVSPVPPYNFVNLDLSTDSNIAA